MIVAPQHSRLSHSPAGFMEDRLVWIDLEMTGLDPIENKIIEIATIVTEGDLTLVSEGPSLAFPSQSQNWRRWMIGISRIIPRTAS